MRQSITKKIRWPFSPKVWLMLVVLAALGAILLADLISGSSAGSTQGPGDLRGPEPNQLYFLGQSLSILLLVFIVGAVLALPAGLLRRMVQRHPRRRAGLVIASGLLACVLMWAASYLNFELDRIFSTIMNTHYYTNLPTANASVPPQAPFQLDLEQMLRLYLPPVEAAPCYTSAGVCQWLATHFTPGPADPRSWPEYLAWVLSNLMLVVTTGRFAWIYTRPPVSPPEESTVTRLRRLARGAFGVSAG